MLFDLILSGSKHGPLTPGLTLIPAPNWSKGASCLPSKPLTLKAVAIRSCSLKRHPIRCSHLPLLPSVYGICQEQGSASKNTFHIILHISIFLLACQILGSAVACSRSFHFWPSGPLCWGVTAEGVSLVLAPKINGLYQRLPRQHCLIFHLRLLEQERSPGARFDGLSLSKYFLLARPTARFSQPKFFNQQQGPFLLTTRIL